MVAMLAPSCAALSVRAPSGRLISELATELILKRQLDGSARTVLNGPMSSGSAPTSRLGGGSRRLATTHQSARPMSAVAFARLTPRWRSSTPPRCTSATVGAAGSAVARSIRALAWPHPMSPSLDHIVPLSLDGEHTCANTRLAHLNCNVTRGNRMGAEQLALIG